MSTNSAYTCVYGSIERVNRELQLTISAETKPSDDDVLQWIEEEETRVNALNLGSQTISGAIIDVPQYNPETYGVVKLLPDELPEPKNGVVVVPPYRPIITISSGYLYRNKANVTGTPDWELLQEGTGSGTDYVLIKKMDAKTGKYLGYAIYFYNNVPYFGYNRLKGNFTYGYNVDSKILSEYVTLQVCKRVIKARLFSGQPMNLATFTAGSDLNTYVNTQYEVQVRQIDERLKEIESKHFPKRRPFSIARSL